MIEGLWTATHVSNIDAFREGHNSEGSGVLLFKDNRILGGDIYYYYVGQYEMIDDRKFTGSIHMVKFIDTTGTKYGSSLLGDFPIFDVEFNGEINDGVMVAAGVLVHDRKITFISRCVKRVNISNSQYTDLERYIKT